MAPEDRQAVVEEHVAAGRPQVSVVVNGEQVEHADFILASRPVPGGIALPGSRSVQLVRPSRPARVAGKPSLTHCAQVVAICTATTTDDQLAAPTRNAMAGVRPPPRGPQTRGRQHHDAKQDRRYVHVVPRVLQYRGLKQPGEVERREERRDGRLVRGVPRHTATRAIGIAARWTSTHGKSATPFPAGRPTTGHPRTCSDNTPHSIRT